MKSKVKRGRRRVLCVVCRLNPVDLLLCTTCAKSYDRALARDNGTVGAALAWAARRAWSFARKTRRRK